MPNCATDSYSRSAILRHTVGCDTRADRQARALYGPGGQRAILGPGFADAVVGGRLHCRLTRRFLIIDWLQQRNVRALAWWGSAYLIGASAMALASMPTPLIELPPVVPGALTFLACGMIWNGVRLFQGRRVLTAATFIPLVRDRPNSRRSGKRKRAGPRRPDRPGLHVFHRLRALAGAAPDTIFACCGDRGASMRESSWCRWRCVHSCPRITMPHG